MSAKGILGNMKESSWRKGKGNLLQPQISIRITWQAKKVALPGLNSVLDDGGF